MATLMIILNILPMLLSINYEVNYMKNLTIEDITAFKDKCENTDKLIRFSDCYLDPEVIKKGLDQLILKINFTAMGFDNLNDADKLLLMLINAQKGINF